MAGQSILKALKSNGYKNILLMNRKELDLTNEKDVSEWFQNLDQKL